MELRPDPVVTARELHEELGLDAVVQAGARAEACRQQGDGEGVRFWNTVARNLRLLFGDTGKDCGGNLRDQVLWRLMQRVEHFRHRAAECRRKGTAGPEPLRLEMLEIEQHWLELATYAEVIADRPPD